MSRKYANFPKVIVVVTPIKVRLFLALRQADHSPLSVPRPFPGTGLEITTNLLQLLVLAGLQADDDVSLAGAQRQNVDTRLRAHGAESLSERSGGVPVSVAGQLAVVQVTLEDDQLSGLHVLGQLRGLVGQTPEATAHGPVAVGAHDELALSVGLGPVAENELEVLDLLLGQRSRGLVLKLLILGLGLEEEARVGDGVEESAEVARENVGDEPRNGLGTEDDLGSGAGGQEVSGEDEIDVQLETGVVEHEVDATLGLALVAGLLEDLVSLRKVVDQDVLLSPLTGLSTLQLLNILVGQVSEERQVSGVSPKTYLEHLGEQQLLGLDVVSLVLVSLELLDELLVLGGQLDDSLARGAEGVELLAGKDVVVLPVGGQAEEGAYPPVHVAFGEQPRDIEP